MSRTIHTAQRVVRSLKMAMGLLTVCLIYGVVVTHASAKMGDAWRRPY